MNIPHDQIKLISLPSNTNRCIPVESADKMDKICCATTDNTSMLMRLNSSKHPHAPVCQRKKINHRDLHTSHLNIYGTGERKKSQKAFAPSLLLISNFQQTHPLLLPLA